MRVLTSSLAAVSLLAASTTAVAAAPALPGNARAASPVQAEEAAGDSTWIWIAGGAVLLLILLLVVLDDDDEDLPTSP